tara:strand:+ start:405 stop:776 length:372 start_codon:yes stop_codon:yes gene_type:complete
MPFSNSIVNNYALNSGNTPLLYPVRIVVPAAAVLGTNFGISFPDQFLGRAISLKITNNDGVNACFYDYNLNGQFQSLAASSFDTVDNTVVNYLTVQAGAAGTTLIEAQVLPATRTEIPIEVMV